MQKKMSGRVRSIVVALGMLAMLGAASQSMAASAVSTTGAAPAAKTLVDLNTASAEQLMGIPGIGEAKANAIIAHRAGGAFSNVGDLVEVKGIGEKLLAKISPYVTTSMGTKKPGTAGKVRK
jgi:competence protein ComEA